MLTIDIIIGMLLVSSISMGALGLYGIKFSRRIPAALPYSLLMFAAAGWAIFYALDLSTSSLSQKVLYHNLRFLFLPFIPLLELWLVIVYVRKPELENFRSISIKVRVIGVSGIWKCWNGG